MASVPGAQPARMATPSVIERAFELARTCASIEEIRRLLREEGYAQVDAHLGGRMIRTQLRALLRGDRRRPCGQKRGGRFNSRLDCLNRLQVRWSAG